MNSILLILLGGFIAIGLMVLRRRYLGFLAQRPDDYRQTTPALDLRRHLNGDIRCDGVIYGPLGRVTSRFEGLFNAKWEGQTGVMTEHFQYDTGTTQDRAWTLSLGPEGQVKATAPDVIGTGEGKLAGSSLCLRYSIRLPDAAGGHVLNVVDWMYLMPNGTIVNRSQFRKYGIKVAELVATLHRVDRTEETA
ncbi:DUF3833 family protein [Lutimaribacter marinistellae]|uniref:DUF3833 family protein n=1 Tax=Lutimaribacter marinistellae TaxID=1820329 RepID=A0ABV7TJ14_9RHOB